MKILLAEADGAPAGRLFHLLVKNGYQTTAVKTGQARTTVSSSRSMTTSCCASRRCSGARRPAASAAAT